MSEMKVPEGYKQTEIGVIPEDWKVTTIGDFAPLQRGFDLPTTKVEAGDYPVVYSNGIVRNHKDFQVKGAGIVTGRSGTIGKVHYIESDFWPHNTTLWVTSFGDAHVKFVYYLFKYIGFERFKSGSGVPTLNRNDAHSFKTTVPTKVDEQTAIATALSDVDNLIQSLEKLIAKKEAIKTGAMQQLLTGKTRLPEFATHDDGSPKGLKQTELGRIPEDWDYKALSEMTENKGLVRGPFGGALKKDGFVRTGFKVYEQRNAIYANTEIGKYYIDKDKFNELQRFTVKPKDFIVSCSGTIGRIYQIPVNAPEGIINQALLKITLNKNTDEHFFYQIFNSKEFQESITDSTQGGAMKNLIGMSEFKKSIMLMPSKPEQTAIATILSDMDVEIQALQQRLEKTRDIKQGMMQQLLTGKVRLAH
ncbi:restriction endonuclease subunit S [Psychrobacter celer]|uniref:restriction endonuclease subunit S n=1 Tax=Psychrobacter celer TaxID=306572 RepID=UPI003FCFF17D